jgi:putative ABC transport system permease protein
MFKNYLKVAFRSMNKNRIFAVINILGLALGLAITILVFLFVSHEISYDKNWDGSDRIYRAGLDANFMGQNMVGPAAPSPMAQTLRTEFTDIESATRIQPRSSEVLIWHDQTKIYVKNTVHADSAFFKVFNYNFIHGDAKTSLKIALSACTVFFT